MSSGCRPARLCRNSIYVIPDKRSAIRNPDFFKFFLDSRLRGNDGKMAFFKGLQTSIDSSINHGYGSRFMKRFTLTSIYGRFAGRIVCDFVARQFCRLISQQRLRPVTLRATLSDGLPFSSSIKLTQWLCQKLIN